jgi:pilus assembly protein CpaF
MSNLFYLDEYAAVRNKENNDENTALNQQNKKAFSTSVANKDKFNEVCNGVYEHFIREWEGENGKSSEASNRLLQTHKKAIIGYSNEVNFFKSKISDYLKNNDLLDCWYPSWYEDLTSAIFHENWGYAGIAQWMERQEFKQSSSAKIIGERIYFLINGKQILQEQRISKDRLKQLVNALLLRNPEVRLHDDKQAEVYTLEGIRIKIFEEGFAKEPVIIFRRYIVDSYTFEEQAKRKTIPYELISALKAMIKVGYNVCFIGPVRSAKTTFLQTWQSYEDPSLEGILVETDPEIPLHLLQPKSPIMQLIADGEKLRSVTKDLMRGDGDYLIVAEARDGVALKVAVQVTAKGTRRVKSTFHTSDAIDFCYDAATEIVNEFGGDLFYNIVKVAKGYNYLFELTSLRDKSQKRLKAIYEIRYNPVDTQISIHKICRYDFIKDDWTFKYDIGVDKKEIGYQEDYEAFKIFSNELKRLAELKPMQGEHVTIPLYSRLMNKNV